MLLNAAIERVKSREYDPSHDYAHVLRVTLLSLRLAKSQNSKAGIQLDLQVVTLAALFHDLLDSKYLPAGQTFPSPRQFLAKFWLENDGKLIGRLDASGRVVAAQGTSNGSDAISDEQKRLVERIIDNVSYSKEIKEIPSEWTKECGELHCVRDADKLDAIGAVGILRCAAYSGAHNIPLLPSIESIYNPFASVGMGKPISTAVSHFHEKLFKLESMMVTGMGKDLARTRTQTMRRFIEALEMEQM